MTLNVDCWQLSSPGEPLVRGQYTVDLAALNPNDCVVKVAGCGVCHTDLSFAFDGVRTRHELPLTLGHEISGVVTHAGADAQAFVGRSVVVPAVIPCGDCEACLAGRGAICPTQIFPGNDVHGGFASHTVVPSRGLCLVDEAKLAASGLALQQLSVIADAVTTPYQAILNADLQAGDVAVFIGVGGVGSYGVQIARAMGAHVAAIDVDKDRVARAEAAGAHVALQATDDVRGLKKTLRGWAKSNGLPTTCWKIFETSGHPKGQELAYALLNHGAHLGVVGYTREKITVRLSNLMAFDATARGTWGCLPEHYPKVVELVLSGQVKVEDYTVERPLSQINETFDDLHHHRLVKRPVLVPDFGLEAE